MDQQHLMDLLVEASTCTDLGRTGAILTELSDAVPAGNLTSREEGIRVVIDSLFSDVQLHNPLLLPQLFPAFAVMCCAQAPQFIVGDIDWSVYETIYKSD